MARTRYLKQEFFQDEELCELSPWHRLCYAGLWTEADRAGRLEDRPKRLKARLFPYDDVDMEGLLTELARRGFVIRYIADGRAYVAIKPNSWGRHQYPRKDEPASRIPAPEEGTTYYASLGTDEALGVGLRSQPPSLRSDAPVAAETPNSDRELGIRNGELGMGNGSTRAETLSRSAPADDSPVLLTFPTDGPVSAWHFTEAKRAEYRGWFPSLDIDSEARAALAWISTNPTKRKTASGMPKFLTNWFTRATESGRGRVVAVGGRTAGNAGNLQRFAARRPV